MNIINEFFVSFILIKLYFKFKVCRKIKFPLLWKFYFSKWKFYFSADNRGEKVFLSSWAQDMNLSSAIKYSNVLAFKEVARRIGIKTMQEYLNKLHYGNAKISKIDTFWLDNSLKISAKEQAILLFRLSQNSLPFSQEAMNSVKEMIYLKNMENLELFGKTGFNDEQKIAWIVGFVYLKDENKYKAFALNLDIDKFEDLYKREKILEKYLDELVKKVKNDG